MLSIPRLDLRGISWPMCLLQFKQNLLALGAGGRLEVLVQDPEVAENILMIIERSGDRVLDNQKDETGFRLRIEKGEGPGSGEKIQAMVLPTMPPRGEK